MNKIGKILLSLLILLVLTTALAESVSGRISFYYQHDGGKTDEAGTWDLLLADRLEALYGHDTIYQDAKTSQYLTGRGCCLFSFAHAYQYLKGYAGTQEAKANLLYRYLAIQPVWSNTASSMSPPKAGYIYAGWLANRSGVVRYRGNLSTLESLQSFFDTYKGVLIINAPGHYITAVGYCVHEGTPYVHIVDSVMSGTIATGRCAIAFSVDFGTCYTPANSAKNSEAVHEYWLPYSQFAAKCDIDYAFYNTLEEPQDQSLTADAGLFLLQKGETRTLTVTNAYDDTEYLSSDTAVCVVSEDGLVTAKGTGQAAVVCRRKADPYNSVSVPVYVVTIPAGQVVAVCGDTPMLPETEGALPDGVTAVYDTRGEGMYETTVRLYAADGTELTSATITALVPGDGVVFSVPEGVTTIEENAFEGLNAAYVLLPASVTDLQANAFAGVTAVVILEEARGTAAQKAFPDATRILTGEKLYAQLKDWKG